MFLHVCLVLGAGAELGRVYGPWAGVLIYYIILYYIIFLGRTLFLFEIGVNYRESESQRVSQKVNMRSQWQWYPLLVLYLCSTLSTALECYSLNGTPITTTPPK